MYLLRYSEYLSSELPSNTYLHPKNVILFLDSFQALKTLCHDISDLKLSILNSLLKSDTSSLKQDYLKN